MQLPKYKNHIRKINKLCQYIGCGKEYIGLKQQKYCDYHKLPSNRKRKRIKFKGIHIDNQIFEHNLSEITKVVFYCPICKKPFDLLIYPKIFIYPKYCEIHRNFHKRKLYALQKIKTMP